MMIGTVFFLAIAAPILAAEYPTTTSDYREPKYRPQTPRGPSNAPSTYGPNPTPSNYNPDHAPGNNNPDRAPGNYNPDRAPGNNNPDRAPGNYNPDRAPGNNNPGQAPSNYNPDRAPGNYNPDRAPGNNNPDRAPGNYNPDRAPGNYNPSDNPQNYNPTRQESRYGSQPSSGPYNAQDDPYTNYPVSSTRNIRREIADASADITIARKTDQIYLKNLEIIAQKINQTSNFRQRFEAYLYQQLVDSIDEQDQKIADYRSQVDGLSDLTRGVADLTNKVNALLRDLGNIRKRQANIRSTAGQVGSSDGAETLSIVTVEDQTDGNDEILELITDTDQTNRARYDANLKDLDAVIQTVNDERVEEYTVVLTARNSSVYVQFETPFNKQPQVAYGIIGLEIDDINDGSQQETNSYRSQQQNNSYGSQQQNNSYGSQQQNNSYGSQQQNNSYGSQQQNNSYGSQQQNNSYGSQQQNNSYGNQQQSNSYGGQQERIFPRVEARADTKGVTVTLIDKSVGWITEYVRVRVLVVYVNNDKISTVSPKRTY